MIRLYLLVLVACVGPLLLLAVGCAFLVEWRARRGKP